MVPHFVANEDQARFDTGHPLEMQVKRYGSAIGFHPIGRGSTPRTRTNASAARWSCTCFVLRWSRFDSARRHLGDLVGPARQLSKAAKTDPHHASLALMGKHRTCNADQVGSTPTRSSNVRVARGFERSIVNRLALVRFQVWTRMGA